MINFIKLSFQKAYSDRIKGLHFCNLPSSANAVVTLISSILSEKLANRVSKIAFILLIQYYKILFIHLKRSLV